MHRILPIASKTDIPEKYQNTPIGLLLEYHNLNKDFDEYSNAPLLTGMCMDHRKKLNAPNNFTYIIRDGGANMRQSGFKISYAIGVAKIGHMALIGHTQCGMMNLADRKQQFIDGLVEMAGWTKEAAEEHFLQMAPMSEIGNEVDFILSQTKYLRSRYPKVQIAPMIYKVEDNQLYLIEE